LYFQDESPRVHSVSVNKNHTLNIQLLPAIKSPVRVISNNKDTFLFQGNNFDVPSEYGTNIFKIIYSEKTSDTIEININQLNKADYSNYDPNTSDDVVIVNSSSIPILTNSFLKVDKWKSDYSYVPESEIIAARDILTHEIHITLKDTDLEKVKKIGKFLLDKMNDKRGIPSAQMLPSTPYQQYLKAINNESKVWCGNFAHIYTFFANLAGVTTRQVDVNSNIGSVITSAHAFNESYINELNCWAFVGLNSSKILVYNKNHRPLNALDLFQLRKMKVYEGISACVYSDTALFEMPYQKVNQSELTYFKREARFTYNFPETYELNYSGNGQLLKKLWKYIIPAKDSLYYSENEQKKNNFLFYAKYFFLYSFLILCLIYSVSIANHLAKNKKFEKQL
jgi:hypothetical protein